MKEQAKKTKKPNRITPGKKRKVRGRSGGQDRLPTAKEIEKILKSENVGELKRIVLLSKDEELRKEALERITDFTAGFFELRERIVGLEKEPGFKRWNKEARERIKRMVKTVNTLVSYRLTLRKVKEENKK